MKYYFSLFVILSTYFISLNAQVYNGTLIVRPKEIDDVLLNPGIGFTTFHRFNGDPLNFGWSDDGSKMIEDKNTYYPESTLAYFRYYWKHLEPKKGNYRWDIIDRTLKKAEENNQTLIIRLMPYGSVEQGNGVLLDDVPDWYRELVGPSQEWKHNLFINRWVVNPEDPQYIEHFGKLVAEFAERYDGHPWLEAVDISIVGAWGEGAGSELLTQEVREALINLYADNFKKTQLISLLTDKKTNQYAKQKSNAGWRADCLGDLGIFYDEPYQFAHMYDVYPQGIINYNLADSWKDSPVYFELCHIFFYWRDNEKLNYDETEVKYIIEQSLKWHMSSINAKSSPVPIEWKPFIDDWLKKMGYRFALRRFTCQADIKRGESLKYQTWWENKGVSPIYKDFKLAFRLKSETDTIISITDANIREWLPGDIVFDNKIYIPDNINNGFYTIQVAIVDASTEKPKVKLAIEGIQADGWYDLGGITIN